SLSRPAHQPHLPSFPTRRSSDLYRLKNFRLAMPAPSPPPRIYLAALGPRMCELAGEVADGVLLNWIPPAAVPDSVQHVEAGAKRSEEHTSELQSLTNLVCRLLLA